jgi:hypothetical protein
LRKLDTVADKCIGAQNVWYGLSLGSVLLLAAIGLAITFGVMGVINMAHGEMVMLGAYTTFVVQEVIREPRRRPVRLSLVIALPLAFLVTGAIGIADRARRHPLPLRPAARNAARDLGPVADPAAGGAHRSSARPTARSATHPGCPARSSSAAHHHLEPALDRRVRHGRVRRAAAGAAQDAARPADARRHAEPPHGLGHGHPHAARRCADLRPRLGHRRASPAWRSARSTMSRPTSARATSSTASWSWCSAASATCGARWSAR